MIVGIWDPTNESELQTAEKFSHYPIIVGYSVGNEGLDVRYKLESLVLAMKRLRQATGKPVTTTEQVNDSSKIHLYGKYRIGFFPTPTPIFQDIVIHRKQLHGL